MDTLQYSESIGVQTLPAQVQQTQSTHNTQAKKLDEADQKSNDTESLKEQRQTDVFTRSSPETEDAQEKAINAYTEIEEKTRETFELLIESVINTSVEFTSDDSSKGSYVKITDKATNELLRTIPSEAMRNVLENIHNHIDELLNESMDENRGHLVDMSS